MNHYIKVLQDYLHTQSRTHPILLILDNVNEIVFEDLDNFNRCLNQLLDKLKQIKILITSRQSFTNISNTNEKDISIYELSPMESIKLLKLKSPKLLTDQEFRQLLKYNSKGSKYIDKDKLFSRNKGI